MHPYSKERPPLNVRRLMSACLSEMSAPVYSQKNAHLKNGGQKGRNSNPSILIIHEDAEEDIEIEV